MTSRPSPQVGVLPSRHDGSLSGIPGLCGSPASILGMPGVRQPPARQRHQPSRQPIDLDRWIPSRIRHLPWSLRTIPVTPQQSLEAPCRISGVARFSTAGHGQSATLRDTTPSRGPQDRQRQGRPHCHSVRRRRLRCFARADECFLSIRPHRLPCHANEHPSFALLDQCEPLGVIFDNVDHGVPGTWGPRHRCRDDRLVRRIARRRSGGWQGLHPRLLIDSENPSPRPPPRPTNVQISQSSGTTKTSRRPQASPASACAPQRQGHKADEIVDAIIVNTAPPSVQAPKRPWPSSKNTHYSVHVNQGANQPHPRNQAKRRS